MFAARIQHIFLLGQPHAAGFALPEMLADIDNLRNREALADSVEGERIIGDVLILAASRANQVLYLESGLKSIRDSPAVAHLAEDDVAMELHFYVLPAADALVESNAHAGARDVDNRAIQRLARSWEDLDLGGIMGLIAGFRAPFDDLWRGKVRDVRNKAQARTLGQTVCIPCTL
jgi:hypothetical protein